MRNSTVCQFEWKTLTYGVRSLGILLHTTVLLFIQYVIVVFIFV